jgi:hypothetical protein
VLVALLWIFPMRHVIAHPFIFLFFAAIIGGATRLHDHTKCGLSHFGSRSRCGPSAHMELGLSLAEQSGLKNLPVAEL